MKYLNNLHTATSVTTTDNGAKTFDTSGSYLLDFYAQAGSMRNSPDKALELFIKAYSEDRLKAIKILFYLRDVRGGQGERDLFRTCLEWIGTKEVKVFESIIKYVSEYGRWDDLFFDNDKAIDFIHDQLAEDFKSDKPSLLAKWLPSINASSKATKAKAKFFVNKFVTTDKEYRKTLSKIRKQIGIVESQMSARKWDEIDYSAVPSQAARIYRRAFQRHDEVGYAKFIEKVESGEKTINAGTLYPYQIYKDVKSNYGEDDKTSNALWKSLPDYTQGKNALVVADVSVSMFGDPMSVSVSLAMYFAERNTGYFKDHFLTFSSKPKLQRIVGDTLSSRMRSIENADWEQNTDITATINLLVDTAVKNNVPVEEMPETIYIISDMEFDECTDGGRYSWQSGGGFELSQSALEMAKNKYTKAGYKTPNIVFWNVNASGSNLPARQNEYGVALVSGFSPVIFKIAVENKTPIEIMNDTIESDRYKDIAI